MENQILVVQTTRVGLRYTLTDRSFHSHGMSWGCPMVPSSMLHWDVPASASSTFICPGIRPATGWTPETWETFMVNGPEFLVLVLSPCVCTFIYTVYIYNVSYTYSIHICVFHLQPIIPSSVWLTTSGCLNLAISQFHHFINDILRQKSASFLS